MAPKVGSRLSENIGSIGRVSAYAVGCFKNALWHVAGSYVSGPRLRKIAHHCFGWAVRGSNPDRGNRCSFSPNLSDQLWGPPIRSVGSFPGDVNRLGRNVDSSRSRSAEVKNEWSCTSFHPLCLFGVDRDNFTTTLKGYETRIGVYNVSATVFFSSSPHGPLSTSQGARCQRSHIMWSSLRAFL